jgi:hypothetical protein
MSAVSYWRLSAGVYAAMYAAATVLLADSFHGWLRFVVGVSWSIGMCAAVAYCIVQAERILNRRLADNVERIMVDVELHRSELKELGQ